MRAIIAKCPANYDKTALTMVVLSLVLIGLVVNSVLILIKRDWEATNEISPFLKRPVIEGEDDIAYIKAYISAELLSTKQEWQPKSAKIPCDDNVQVVTSSYLYARIRDEGKYSASLTCTDSLQNNICSGHTYLDDPKLKSILNKVSPYLTQNILTENDLRMASLALEFKNRTQLAYTPNYEEPKVAYLVMSASTPSYLHYAFDHIRCKTSNDTIIYSTFDYNSRLLEEYTRIIQNYSDVKVLPTHWFGNWGGISLVYIEVSAWLELLKMEGWDYLINISDGDGFVVPADLIQQRVKELNGQSILECPYPVAYSQGHNGSCLIVDASYRYNDVWLDCGSSIRTIKYANFTPKFPSYANYTIKASQWKILTRSVIEKLVSSQDFWDILFSYRHSMVPDEHAIVNAIKRILPDEKFIHHNIHMKNWNDGNYIDKEAVLTAIKQGSWFIRKVRTSDEWGVVERVREEHWTKSTEKEQTEQ